MNDLLDMLAGASWQRESTGKTLGLVAIVAVCVFLYVVMALPVMHRIG